MKKRIWMAVLCCLFTMAAGCAQQPISSETPQQPSPSQTEPVQTPVEPLVPHADPPLMVADAAMYRGTVIERTTAEGGVLLTLRQPDGIDFGAAERKFYVTENTRLSFEKELLATGEFLEVYYGTQEQPDGEARQAIAINRYALGESMNFNGTVMSYMPNTEKPGTGTLQMRDLAGNQVVMYNFGAETQFYLDASSIKAGDKLNIFHRGMLAMSEPPQGYALEVRQYRQTNAYPSTGASL